MLSQLMFVLAMSSASSAHFVLQYPPTAGFDDDAEPNSPCGGAMVTVNSTSPQIQVDRWAISILSTHPAGSWTFRGTTSTEEPYEWSGITPGVNSTGVGTFCLDYMHVPSDWAGKSGVIQVIDDSVDGTLYQCAPVNFVSGANSTIGSACTNATGFAATWSSAEVSSSNASASSTTSTASGIMSSGSSMSMTSGAPSSTASGSAASTSASAASAAFVRVGGAFGVVGLLAAGLTL